MVSTLVYCVVSAVVAAFAAYHLGFHRGVMHMTRLDYTWRKWIDSDAHNCVPDNWGVCILCGKPVAVPPTPADGGTDADRDTMKARVEEMFKDGNLKAPYTWQGNTKGRKH